MTFPLSADSEHDTRERFMANPTRPVLAGACRLPAARCKYRPGRSRRAGGSVQPRAGGMAALHDRSACD